jgi:hypothetical protein
MDDYFLKSLRCPMQKVPTSFYRYRESRVMPEIPVNVKILLPPAMPKFHARIGGYDCEGVSKCF